MSAILQTLSSTANNSNITTELLLATYTADAERIVVVQPRLSNLNAAAASIYFRLEHTTGADALLACQADVMAATKCVATQTIFGTRMSVPVLLAAGDKLKVYAKSDNASDTQASYSIAIIDATAGADLVAAVWGAVARTLTAFAFTPSLDPAYDAAKTAAQPGDTMEANNIDGIPAATAALVLATPAYPIATDAAGAVTAGNSTEINPQDIADALGLAPEGAAAAGSVNALLAGLDAVKPAHAPSVDAEGVVTANATVDTDAIAAAVVEGLGDSVASPADVEAATETLNAAIDAAAQRVLNNSTGVLFTTEPIINSETGLPVDDVEVRLTSDEAGNTTEARDFTDGTGTITVRLPAGSYFMWMVKSGYSFTGMPYSVEITE